MNIRKYILAIVGTILATQCISNDNVIRFSASMDKNVGNGMSVEIHVLDDLYRSDLNNIVKRLSHKDILSGKRISISSERPLYIRVFAEDLSLYRKISLQEYLVEPGDDFTIRIESDTILFEGESSAKLRLQQILYSFEYKSDSRFTSYYQTMVEKLAKFNKIISIRDSLLHVYKNQISNSSFKRLACDIIGDAYLSLYNTIRTRYILRNKDIEGARQIVRFYRDSCTAIFPAFTKDDDSLVYSRSYAQMCFEKIRLDIMFSGSVIDTNFHRPTFNDFLPAIRKVSNDRLRDKLLAILALEYMAVSKTAQSKADSIVQAMTTPEYIEVVQKYVLSVSPGAFMFSFELPDSAGIIHSLDQYLGKVLVIDFWFYGCGPCKMMARNLDSLYRKLGKRKDLLFLSINVDKNKELWLKGLKSGDYGGSYQVNLNTNGLGFHHPLIRHYKYNAFPQLLLVDQTGRLILSANDRILKSNDIKRVYQIIMDRLNG